MDLTNDDVAEILALLDSLPYDELDLQTPRFRLTLRRVPGGWTEESQVVADPAMVTQAPDGSPAGRPPAGSSTSVRPTAALTAESASSGRKSDMSDLRRNDEAERAGLVAVAAPLPGTFYRAPRPGAAPFVEVGDEVAEDTVVAIVETMKLMNSVHAGTPGRVVQICLENADPVTQGATLMWIEPGT
jgi:acetyl-CoA carboxylase biotin carboxyl carrier protein